MEKKTGNRLFFGSAAIVVIAASAILAGLYGTGAAAAGVVLPGKQAEVEARLSAKEAEEPPAGRVSVPLQEPETPVVQPAVTPDMPMEPLTETGLYPEQEAAMALSVQDLLREPEPEPEPVYVAEPAPAQTVPVTAPAPEPVYAAEPVPVQPAPAPPVPVIEPVLTDNQQEGCVGDGLTY